MTLPTSNSSKKNWRRKSETQPGKPDAKVTAADESQPNRNQNADAVSVSVEEQPASDSGLQALLAKAQARVETGTPLPAAVEVETPKKKWKSAYRSKTEVQSETAEAIAMLITIAVSLATIPPEVEPNEDEITGISYHLAGISLRHFPISHKLGPDAKDILGIVLVISGWYRRARPYLNRPGDNGSPRRFDTEPQPPGGNGAGAHIAQASPGTAEFLEAVAAKAEEQ